jgi:hypothetical protein
MIRALDKSGMSAQSAQINGRAPRPDGSLDEEGRRLLLAGDRQRAIEEREERQRLAELLLRVSALGPRESPAPEDAKALGALCERFMIDARSLTQHLEGARQLVQIQANHAAAAAVVEGLPRPSDLAARMPAIDAELAAGIEKLLAPKRALLAEIESVEAAIIYAEGLNSAASLKDSCPYLFT